MSTFKPGTGGTLKSTNIPAAINECLTLIELEELNQGVESKLNTFTHSKSSKTMSFSGTYEFTRAGTGEGSTITPIDYLPGYTFNPGSGDGDLTATNLPGALHQLLILAISAQLIAGITPITNFSNTGTGTAITYTGSFPLNFALDASGNSYDVIVDNL